jgi:MFS superfamily sulfate permease-like transporter
MDRVDLKNVLPITDWFGEYNAAWLRSDLVAGATVAAAVIPEGMAYASLAGLPLETGLYASLAAVTAYLFVGTSKQVIVGPTSALAVLLVTQVGAVAANVQERTSHSSESRRSWWERLRSLGGFFALVS